MESTLSYATTPLALASLVIIAGVGVLKLIVSGKNNALSRLVTHYGFAVVIVFGLIGNAIYLYNARMSSEMIILGNVVDKKSGNYLPNVVIDTGGHARGMTSDTGDFVLAIPASREDDSYEISAVLTGYERATKKIKNASKMFVRFELAPKEVQVSDEIKLADHEIVIGHYMGLPEVYLPISIDNLSTTLLTVNNFSLSLTSPSGKTRQLILVNSAASMSSQLTAPLTQIEVKARDHFSWSNVFVQPDSQVQQLSASTIQALQSIQEFRQFGPRAGHQVLTLHQTKTIQQMLSTNWFWEPGITTIRLSCNANGLQYELVRKINLSGNQVDAMRQISNYYNDGYGLMFGSDLTPVGSAQPAQKVKTDGA